jgi:7-cyano-7-deazaguanine synthase in queuosine biosynthesis
MHIPKIEDEAINLFNRALKLNVKLSVEVSKKEAKLIVLNNIQAIKEALYIASLIENNYLKIGKTIDYYNKIKEIINKL